MVELEFVKFLVQIIHHNTDLFITPITFRSEAALFNTNLQFLKAFNTAISLSEHLRAMASSAVLLIQTLTLICKQGTAKQYHKQGCDDCCHMYSHFMLLV